MKNFIVLLLLGAMFSGLCAQQIPAIYTDGGSNADGYQAILSDGSTAVTLGTTRRYPGNENRQRMGVYLSCFDSTSGLVSGHVLFDSPDNDYARDLVVVDDDTLALVSSDDYSDGTHESRIFRWAGGQVTLRADTTGTDLWAGVAHHDTLIVVGHTMSQFDEDALIGRLMPGDTIIAFDTLGWLPGQQRLFDVALLGDSLAIAVGSTDAPSATGSGMWIVAFHPVTLDTVWTREVLAGNAAAAYGVATSDYGDIYVVGRFNSAANNYDIIACRYDHQGLPAPNTPVSWGSLQGNDQLRAVAVDDTVVCAAGSGATSNHSDVYLVEMNLDLSIRCDTTFGSGAASESAYAVSAGSPGGTFQVAGTVLPGVVNNLIPAQADGFVAWFGCALDAIASTSPQAERLQALSVYPNPIVVGSELWVSGLSRPTSWQVVSLTGQVVGQGQVQSGQAIAVPRASGLYLLRLEGYQPQKIMVR